MCRLYIVGLGPGSQEHMTASCRFALEQADVLIGYTRYIESINAFHEDKLVMATPMRGEEKRCRQALAQATTGRTVALVCSGDAGVYGMASLLLELAPFYPPCEIEIIPGITAALSGAALLGAPLAHDFAVISLSDLLTPWSQIEKRLEHAAAADFCLAIYNPASRGRRGHLARACDILLRHKSAQTACGITRQIARPGEHKQLLNLQALRDADVDMLTTVFVGNAETRIVKDWLVTPRGYKLD